MLYGWTRKQLDCAIERMSQEIAEAVRRHEEPDKIYRLRRQMERMEAIRERSGGDGTGRAD